MNGGELYALPPNSWGELGRHCCNGYGVSKGGGLRLGCGRLTGGSCGRAAGEEATSRGG